MSYNDGVLVRESIDTVSTTKLNGLGARRWEDGREYVYVYNAGGAQVGPGYGVCLSATTGYSVTVSSVTSINPCFGVRIGSTLTTAAYGWVVREGFVSVKNGASTGLAAGDKIVLGTDGVSARVTGATGYLADSHGYMVQATGTAGTGYAYISCK